MKKLYTIIIIFVVALGLVSLFWSEVSAPAEISSSITTNTATTTPRAEPITLSLQDRAWNIFQSYLVAAKKHDLATLSALSYQLSEACKDKNKIKDCEVLMDNAYSFGSPFTKKDVPHIAYDDKQIILYGDYQKNLNGDAPAIARGIIYFVREGANIKFLSFNPFQGAFIIRNGTEATSTISAKLDSMTADSDGDTLADDIETCSDQNELITCTPTDPHKKDTDSNGWWDSTEAVFYKK